MNRDTQEREQLFRKFEEVVPYLKTLDNYAFSYPPKCDPRFEILPVNSYKKPTFKKFTINVKTGEFSEVVYYDDKGVHRIKAGVTPVDEREWQCDDYKYPCPHYP